MKINKLIDKYIENDVDIMGVHIDVLYEYAKEYNALAKENKQLKETIDKAKEYIKRNYRVLLLTDPPREAFDINELLEILGEKE